MKKGKDIMIKNSKGKLIFEFNDVIDIIDTLSHSQGFYGRLLRDIYELKKYEPEMFAMFVNEIESQNFTNTLDIVMYFEG
jgi:hypothetical protein